LCQGAGEYDDVIATSDDADRHIRIRIPDNRLVVAVSDASTGHAVAGAALTYWRGRVTDEDNGQPRLLGTTDNDGTLVAGRLAAEVPFTVCAGATGFRRTCREDVELPRSGKKELKLSIEREETQSGRVVSDTPIVDGTLYATLGGSVLSHAKVDADGAFVLPTPPPAGAAFFLSASSQPLSVLQKSASEDPLLLRVPVTFPRTFTVTAREAAPVTLLLGDTLVPVTVMLQHLGRYRQQYYVRPNEPITVYNVDGSQPITVILSRGPAGMADPFIEPRLLQSMPKLVVTPAGRVDFP